MEEGAGSTTGAAGRAVREVILAVPGAGEEGRIVRLRLDLADVYYGRAVVPEPRTLYDALMESLVWKKKEFENRATALYGDPEGVVYAYGPTYGDYSSEDRKPRAWTPQLLAVKTLVEEAVNHIDQEHYGGEVGRQLGGSIRFNVCLANYYRNGKEGIGFHADKEEEGALTPIASVSLGSARKFLFTLQHRAQQEPQASDRGESRERVRQAIVLESGSLLVMWKRCQRNYLHSIPKDKNIKEGRINLTFRYVPPHHEVPKS